MVTNIGCPNSPGKGIRYCDAHTANAGKFIAEEYGNNDQNCSVATGEDLLIKSIISNKETRQGNLCQVSRLN